MNTNPQRDATEREAERQTLLAKMYPEVRVGGFSRLDGTLEFYTRVNALLHDGMTVLDYGAGRAEWFENDQIIIRRNLRNLKGKVREVVGVDVDPVLKQNPTIDRAVVVAPGQKLPLPDASIDLVVSDFTFEHVADPQLLGTEFARIVKPEGWVCARTPNKWGYIAVSASLVPNRLHAKILKHVQPGRQALDVFPTLYLLNTSKALRRHFPDGIWDRVVYSLSTEPVYFGNSPLAWRTMRGINRHVPRAFDATLLIFIRRLSG